MKPTTRRENRAIEELYMSIFTEEDAPRPLASAARVLTTQEEEEDEGKDPKKAPKPIQNIRKQAEDLVKKQSAELDQAADDLEAQSKSM